VSQDLLEQLLLLGLLDGLGFLVAIATLDGTDERLALLELRSV
jgi:hypothetical protein